MTVTEFRPGDTLEVIIGSRNVNGVFLEQSEYITYEDLQEILKNAESRKDQPRQYRTTTGATFNRNFSLFTRAVETGEWSTGAVIDREKMAQSFLRKAEKLHPQDLKEIKTKILNDFSDTIRKHQKCFKSATYDRLTHLMATVRGWI
jgi:DNA-directed RNA polymerase subunit F